MKRKIGVIAALLIISSHSFAEICGPNDDRVASFDPRVGKLVKEGEFGGCTAALVGNDCVITIGECANNRDYVEFNVPQSIAGVPQSSEVKDRYYVDHGFTSYKRGGIGNQWAVLKLQKNSVTNLSAGEVQGVFKLASKKQKKNIPVRVVGYAYALNDLYEIKVGETPANKYPDTLHYAQQVSRGKLVKPGVIGIPEMLEHTADTFYGSWGAPIINEETDEVVGITTHGGCSAKYVVTLGARYTNAGTSVTGSKEFRQAIKQCLAHK